MKPFHESINYHCRRGYCFVKPEDAPMDAVAPPDAEADPDLDDDEDDKADAEIVAYGLQS